MRFGEIDTGDAVGAIAAHSVRTADVGIRKGERIDRDIAERLVAAGVARIVVARLGPDDVGENEAAFRLAEAVGGHEARIEPAFTGRCNLFARQDGIVTVAAEAVDALNAVDEALTLATLPNFRPVRAGDMIATVKVIPYAVDWGTLARAVGAAGGGAIVDVAPFRIRRVGLVSTLTPGFKPSVAAKTGRVLGRRLERMGAAIVQEADCPHETEALRAAIEGVLPHCELLVVFGASAIADRRDVVPAAIEAAGGRVEHLGMPVDPGNLLLLGSVGTRPVLGAPGCARSPRENGFDWILARLVAELPVSGRDVARLGVGGLLGEIVSRHQPRGGGDPVEGDDDDA